jgi:uncharacterized SAM-binding protein YcdF (DUF218 family)
VKWALAAAALLLVAVVVLVEAAYRVGYLAARDGGSAGSCVVLVLGHPTRADGSIHPMQQLRVEAGLAAQRANGCDRLILSGAAVANAYVEARAMAEVARALGASDRDLIVDERARNTWQNVGCAAQHARGYERLLVVSDSLHVHRAKRYACRQDRALCAKVLPIGVDPPLALLAWKVEGAFYELRAWIRDSVRYATGWSADAATCPDRDERP